jgi:hypothetical protein
VNKIDDDSGACKLTQEETRDVTGGGDDSLASGDGEDEIPDVTGGGDDSLASGDGEDEIPEVRRLEDEGDLRPWGAVQYFSGGCRR